MKQYKQILEAINRGIQLALDDFEENNEITSKSEVIHVDDSVQSLIRFYVKQMNSISLRNTINIDPSIKHEIRKLYEMIKMLLSNTKYTVLDKMELKELCKHIIVIEPKCNLNWIDTSKITNMSSLFDDFLMNQFCGDVSEWDVSNVRMFVNMFNTCEEFNCDLSKWDVHNAEKMNYMFGQCRKFNSDISKWNVSKVLDMSGMFSWCTSFNQDLSSWDVSNVKDMSYMFSNAAKFNQNISCWDVSNVESNNGFYFNAKFSYTPEFVPNFDLSKTMGNAGSIGIS